ncbi:MAG: hypothetical protein FJX57_06270 [Alphaproteobacteria bacterium]|nr:hypothetical protein [Alphaproteobacteria bacterium]
MRQELARCGITVSDEDLDAMRAPLARVKALLRTIRSEVAEDEEPAFRFRLDVRHDDSGGDHR